MAKTLGISGSDKLALRKVLDAYLQTTVAEIAAVDDFQSAHCVISQQSAFLADIEAYFVGLAAIVEFHAQRWARLLNGEPMDPPPVSVHTADVIQGPWLRRRE
jgi:hypothetical protein